MPTLLKPLPWSLFVLLGVLLVLLVELGSVSAGVRLFVDGAAVLMGLMAFGVWLEDRFFGFRE